MAEASDSFGTYHYAMDNPVMFNDPRGDTAPARTVLDVVATIMSDPRGKANGGYWSSKDPEMAYFFENQWDAFGYTTDVIDLDNGGGGGWGGAFTKDYDTAYRNFIEGKAATPGQGGVALRQVGIQETRTNPNWLVDRQKEAFGFYEVEGGDRGGTWPDPVNIKAIAGLDSRLQQPASYFLDFVHYRMGVDLRITQGYRSIADQNAKYAQGRTTPGSIITNAKGGQSYHQYGLAFDVVIMENGKPNWNKTISPDIASWGNAFGFDWGGSWKSFKDNPHFQMTFGQSWQQLYKQSQK